MRVLLVLLAVGCGEKTRCADLEVIEGCPVRSCCSEDGQGHRDCWYEAGESTFVCDDPAACTDGVDAMVAYCLEHTSAEG